MHATRGRPKVPLAVTPEDRQPLERSIRRRTNGAEIGAPHSP
jgi:hypothetical protein